VYLQKQNYLDRKDVPRGFPQHQPDFPFSYLNRYQQHYEADCKETEDPDHGVALHCGVVRCLSEKNMNVPYIPLSNMGFISAVIPWLK